MQSELFYYYGFISSTIRRIGGWDYSSHPGFSVCMVKVFNFLRKLAFTLMPRPMVFKLGVGMAHSKLLLPSEFGLTRSKVKVTVSFN